MNIFEKIGKWFRDQAQLIRLKYKISKVRKKLNRIYKDLGKDYVREHRYDPEAAGKELLQEAIRLETEIEGYESDMDTIRGIVRCISCKERIPNGASFCPYCGIRQPEPEVKLIRFCPTCGTKLEVDEIYCHHCGTRIPEDDAVTEEIVMRNIPPVKEPETIVKTEG